MTSQTDKTPDELKPDILQSVLAHVPFDGWSQAAVDRAAQDMGMAPGMIKLAFPGGPIDIIDYFSGQADVRLTEHFATLDLEALKIRDRVTQAVRFRIEQNTAHREAARKAVNILALPQNTAKGLAMLNATVDTIWRACGDTSTDFNYYSKRMILAGVFSTTLLYWLSDESEDYTDTWRFLDRRIKDVMKIEKAKASVQANCGKLPDLWGFLGRIRYPNTTSTRH